MDDRVKTSLPSPIHNVLWCEDDAHVNLVARLLTTPLRGADGEGAGGQGTTTATQGAPAGNGQSTGVVDVATGVPLVAPPDDTDDLDLLDPTATRTYTLAQYRKAIDESKKYRQRAQIAEGELTKFREKDMSEIEKANSRAAMAETQNAELKAQLQAERVGRVIITEAGDFADPSDVILHIDLTDLKMSDDGLPDSRALKAAIKRLATEKPYLLKSTTGVSGSGDGGARGGTPPPIDYDKYYQDRGMVAIPR